MSTAWSAVFLAEAPTRMRMIVGMINAGGSSTQIRSVDLMRSPAEPDPDHSPSKLPAHLFHHQGVGDSKD